MPTRCNLEAVAQSLHAFENLLGGLRANPSLRNEDFLPVTVRVKGLYAEIHAIQDAMARIVQVRGVVTVEPPKPAQDPDALHSLPFVRQWHGFAQQIAERHDKEAELSYQGLDLENARASNCAMRSTASSTSSSATP